MPVEGGGCTPGYWKNHSESWVGYSPGDLVGDVFSDVSDHFSMLADYSLMDALKFGGGKPPVGTAKNLLRISVAALLNAAHPELGYVYTEAEIIDAVNAALASGDAHEMEMLKNDLDGWNNDLPCFDERVFDDLVAKETSASAGGCFISSFF